MQCPEPFQDLDLLSYDIIHFRAMKHSSLSSKNKPYVQNPRSIIQAAKYSLYETQEIRR
jgi:hypothetical protein